MKNRFILDTSFLSAILFESDYHHESAKSILNEIKTEDEMVVPISVLLELEVILSKQKLKKQDKVDFIINGIVDNVIYLDEDFYNIYKRFLRANPFNLKTLDLSIAVSCYLSNGKVLTFDKKLEKFCLNLSHK